MSHRWMMPVGAALIALGLAAGGFAVGRGLERWQMADRSIVVKGLAERDVQSDFAVWSLSFRRAGDDFAGVQRALEQDRDRVVAFLKAAGFAPEEFEAQPLRVEDAYAREYAQRDQPLRFSGTGRVLVRSARVAEVQAAARRTDPLIQAGMQLGSDGGPNYQLRGFNAVKAPLLAEATRNAREQANKFAEQAGAELGALKSANQGVISILGDDGSSMDDGSSRTKRLRVVSTFEYQLR